MRKYRGLSVVHPEIESFGVVRAKWVTGYYFYSTISFDHNIITNEGDIIEVSKDTVGESIELADANGNEVFCGMKLKFTAHDGLLLPNSILTVSYDSKRLCFGVTDELGRFFAFADFDELQEDLLNYCEITE